MYKHLADSIKESDNKMFISKYEKEKFSNYENEFVSIDETYNKNYLNEKMNEFNNTESIVSSTVVRESNTRYGYIKNVELYGNTRQKNDVFSVNIPLSSGSINSSTGSNITDTNSYRSDFIEVEQHDYLTFFSLDDNECSVNVFYYDKSKNFLIHQYGNVLHNSYVIMGAKYVRIVSTNSNAVKMIINRTYLNKIDSISKSYDELTESSNVIRLFSCGKNIIGHEWEQGSTNGQTGEETDSEHQHYFYRIRSKYFIPIKEGETHITYSTKPNTQYKAAIRFFDENKNFIFIDKYNGFINDINETVINIPKNAKYIRFTVANIMGGTGTTDNVLMDPKTFPLDNGIQFEYGSIKTEYEPYQFSKCEINIPYALHKVCNISDRLFKREDGVWCIEKNIKEKIITSDDTYYSDTVLETTHTRYILNISDSKYIGKWYGVFCDNIPSWNHKLSNTKDIQSIGIFAHNDTNKIHIRVANYLTSINTTDNIKKLLIGSKILYATINPEIIELSEDIQILLNSFDNKTHVYMMNEDVNGDIKCTLTKSFNSSLESTLDTINILSDNVDSLKKLNSGQKIKHETNDKYITLSNCKGSVIDDINIHGNTLVNVLDNSWKGLLTFGGSDNNVSKNVSTNNTDHYKRTIPIKHVKPNTTYTVFCVVHKNTMVPGQTFVLVDKYTPGEFIGGEIVYIPIGYTGIMCTTFKSGSVIDNGTTYHKTYLRTQSTCTNPGFVEIGDVMILEGDHTDKRLSYFTGVSSVGQDKFSLQSTNRNLLNLLECKDVKLKQHTFIDYLSNNSLKIYTNSNVTVAFPSIMFDDLLDLIPGMKYRIRCKAKASGSNSISVSIRSHFTNSTTMIDMHPSNGYIEGTFTATHTKHRLEFFVAYTDNLTNVSAEFTDIMLTIDGMDTEYIDSKQSKKDIYYYDKENNLKPVVLRSIENTVYDTIEKHNDGKFYYHKRCEEILLDGSFTYVYAGSDTQHGNENYSLYSLYPRNYITRYGRHKDWSPCLSSKFNRDTGVWKSTYNGEAIEVGTNIDIKVANSRFTTPSAASFNEWVSKNPITYVYVLESEEVYECCDLTLDMYKDTVFVCNSTVPPSEIKINVLSYIGDVINNIKDRVSLLEDTLYQKYLVKNKQLLQSRSLTDTTLFNVSVSTCSNSIGVSNELDHNLIELILKNILVGKDNYDETNMIDLIDFYTMVGKISFEIADTLFEIIENQHEEIEM